MWRALVLFFVFSLLVNQSLGCAPATAPGQNAIAADTIARLRKGVFEVVVPKPEDEGIKYKNVVPDDLLPFDQRNDKFVGIGTAFAISPTRFVTAAHVISAELDTPHERYYLRDASGGTYEIGRIAKYSQYRDIVEFEPARTPANVVPLERRTSVDVGETVLTVGNAQAEGIVVRSGSITSFTPEPVDGEWKYVRFTAPASPGNSGGPLVDLAGRVLGVVVAKSGAENLNYAVPIAELEKLSAQRSEFWVKGIPIAEDGKQVFEEWRFASPLPTSLAELREAARASLRESFLKWYADFEVKFSKDIVPTNGTLRANLRDPTTPFGLGRFSVDGNGQWQVASTSYVNKELAPGQTARFFEAADHRGGEVILDRPRGVPLSVFYQSPKILADAVVHNYSWGTTFAGRRVEIETMGEPSERERWVDQYGRPWFTWVWQIKKSDSAFVFSCLTHPTGWACRWKQTPIEVATGVRLGAKRDADRTTLYYSGRFEDWTEFLALPDDYKPKVLTNAVVRFDKTLTLGVGPFSGSFDLPSLADTSMLYVYASIDPASSTTSQRITEARIYPQKDGTYSFGMYELLEPVAQSSERYAKWWKNIQAANAPYNNVLALDGKTNAIKRAVKLGDPTKVYVEYCRSGTDDAKTDLQSRCASFQEAVKITQRP